MEEEQYQYLEYDSKDEAVALAVLMSNRFSYETKVYELNSGIWFSGYRKNVNKIDGSSGKQRITRVDVEKSIVRGVLLSYPDIPNQSKECKSRVALFIRGFLSEESALAYMRSTFAMHKLSADHSNIGEKGEVCAFKLDDGLWMVREVSGGAKKKDIKKSSNKEKDTVAIMPDFAKGVAIKAFSFGHYGAILYKDCPLSNKNRIPFWLRIFVVKYRYALRVFGAALRETEFIVTHEKIPLAGSCICSLEYDNLRKNYGDIDDKIGENGFLDASFAIVKSQSQYEDDAKVIREVDFNYWK